MIRVTADNGVRIVKSPKFKSSKAAYKWLTPFYMNGYKVTIVGRAKRVNGKRVW